MGEPERGYAAVVADSAPAVASADEGRGQHQSEPEQGAAFRERFAEWFASYAKTSQEVLAAGLRDNEEWIAKTGRLPTRMNERAQLAALRQCVAEGKGRSCGNEEREKQRADGEGQQSWRGDESPAFLGISEKVAEQLPNNDDKHVLNLSDTAAPEGRRLENSDQEIRARAGVSDSVARSTTAPAPPPVHIFKSPPQAWLRLAFPQDYRVGGSYDNDELDSYREDLENLEVAIENFLGHERFITDSIDDATDVPAEEPQRSRQRWARRLVAQKQDARKIAKKGSFPLSWVENDRDRSKRSGVVRVEEITVPADEMDNVAETFAEMVAGAPMSEEEEDEEWEERDADFEVSAEKRRKLSPSNTAEQEALTQPDPGLVWQEVRDHDQRPRGAGCQHDCADSPARLGAAVPDPRCDVTPPRRRASTSLEESAAAPPLGAGSIGPNSPAAGENNGRSSPWLGSYTPFEDPPTPDGPAPVLIEDVRLKRYCHDLFQHSVPELKKICKREKVEFSACGSKREELVAKLVQQRVKKQPKATLAHGPERPADTVCALYDYAGDRLRANLRAMERAQHQLSLTDDPTGADWAKDPKRKVEHQTRLKIQKEEAMAREVAQILLGAKG
eukprot:g4829.t1